jgi:hypothetical protein
MWNLITLDGFFEGEKAWDLGFHGLVYDKELEAYTIEQMKRHIKAWQITGLHPTKKTT